MSSAADAGHHGDNPHADDISAHASFRGYMTGFALSVVLTAIPFWLVMGKVLTNTTLTAFLILGLAAVQMLVHVVYFLHMNTKSEGGWNFLALMFTVVLVVITLSGSIWVMYHLNTNMMPMSPEDVGRMRNMP